MRWMELWEIIPNKKRHGAGWTPPLPLILAAWGEPDMLKIARLREQIEWANEHNALESVDKFLRRLPENEWFHIND